MKVISDDIKKGEFKSVYLLYGEEEYLKKQYRDRLKNAIAGDDTMNYSYYDCLLYTSYVSIYISNMCFI